MLKITHPSHVPTTEADALKHALQKLGVKVRQEVFDGHKCVDLEISKAKIDLEIDGVHHLTDPNQILSDLNRSYHSHRTGFSTMHIQNEMIHNHLKQISEALAEASKIREHKIHIHID